MTDGGDLDADGEANGVIVDPAGLADGDPSSASSTSGALADTGQNQITILQIGLVLLIMRTLYSLRLRLKTKV